MTATGVWLTETGSALADLAVVVVAVSATLLFHLARFGWVTYGETQVGQIFVATDPRAATVAAFFSDGWRTVVPPLLAAAGVGTVVAAAIARLLLLNRLYVRVGAPIGRLLWGGAGAAVGAVLLERYNGWGISIDLALLILPASALALRAARLAECVVVDPVAVGRWTVRRWVDLFLRLRGWMVKTSG